MTPPYLMIAAQIRTRIESGQLAPGQPVPSTRQIMRRWKVAMATATKALATLQREGLISSVRGAGSVVARPASAIPRTTEPAPLNRGRVVRAAIAIADAEGLAALSMRRIAADLGVAVMALYRHVEDKDDLLDDMAEEVLGEAGLPTGPCQGWREKLDALARLQWATYHRHPWLAQVLSGDFSRPVPRPNGMAHTDWILAAIEDAPLGRGERLHLAVTLVAYVQATALKHVVELDVQDDTGLTAEDYLRSARDTLHRILDSGRFPALARLLRDADIDFDLESLFAFGLERLLDGFAVILEPRAAKRRTPR